MHRRRFLAVAGMAVATAGLAACGGGAPPASDETPLTADPAELERLAKAEGEVVWYSGGINANEPAKKAFEQRYGITLTYSRYSSADMAQRVQADVRSTGSVAADCVSISDTALLTFLRRENLTRAVTAADFPGFPAEFMLGDAGPLTQLAVAVVGTNSQQLAGFAPRTWQDLLDPRLSGRIMVNDPRNSATWLQLWYDVLNTPALGESYLQAIAAQSYQPVASAPVGTEQLAGGQGSVLLASVPSLIDAAAEKGAPVGYYFPVDPSPVSYTAMSMVRDAAHPNAAYLFVRWAASEEGQTVLNAGEGTASVLGDLPGAVPRPANLRPAPDPDLVKATLPRITELLGFG
jgi:iron(III) transport system substrate-binding protein